MYKEDHSQIYQMLSVLFLTLSKGQQVQQCIREVLTSNLVFSPMPLFRYLSKKGTVIKKEHIVQFMEDNDEQIEDQEAKKLMQFEAGKKSWQYKDFLQFIYPFNSAILRQVNQIHLKKYPKLDKYVVPESTLAGFLLLLVEHLNLIRKLESQKSDSWQRIPKERLRKVLLSIKKAGEKQPSHCQNDNQRITSLELRNFMKAFVSVEDSHFLYLSRRLGIKNGFFLIEELENFLKPTKKGKKLMKSQKTTPIKAEAEQIEQFDQKQYKDQILEELAHDVSSRSIKKSSPLKPSPKKIKEKPRQIDSDLYQPAKNKNRIHNDNYFSQSQNHQPQRLVSSPKDLLIKFIEVFLPSSRRLEQLKLKLSQHRLDYFKLFKIIDRSGRGVVGTEDLMEYYRWAGGRAQFQVNDFELLVQRYAQSDEPWITLTQFCQMVRADDKQGINRGNHALGEEMHGLVVRIMQVSLESQMQILKIRRQFRKQESKYLFNLINREQTGFINYQELKRFLNESGLQLSMHDLMLVLKRLDRSRNGVVVEHEFISYFRAPEQF